MNQGYNCQDPNSQPAAQKAAALPTAPKAATLPTAPKAACSTHCTKGSSQLKMKAVATVDYGSIICCDIGAIRQRNG